MPPTNTTTTTRRRPQYTPGSGRGRIDREDTRTKSEMEDENAGQGVTRILGVIALVVVMLIVYRGTLLNQQEDERNNMVEVPLDAETPSNEASIQQSRKEENNFVESYPVELLKDDNGTRSVKELDGDDEAVKQEEALEKASAQEYQVKLQQRHKEAEQHEKDEDEGMVEDATSATDDDASKPAPPQQTTTTSHKKRVASLGNLLFEDGALYETAPMIELHPDAGKPFKGMWDLLVSHEEYYKKNPHRRYVPRLAETVSRSTFHRVFRITSTPVIISFEHARALGFLTKQQSVEELREKHPYDPEKDSSPLTYNTASGRKTKLDLGPAVYAISKDAKLEKIGVGVRNFPRNLQLSSKNMASLEVSRPPYIQRKRFQPASMWFGTSSSPTKFHHDCCDNFVMMVAGVKRWFLAPITDWRRLMPIRCEGDHQSLCWATVPYPNLPKDDREKAIVASLSSVVIDLHPGEMLYLPAGWFHHIENLGPTVMLNHWTFGCQNVGMQLELDPYRKDRADFKSCPAAADAEKLWREKEDKNCEVCV